MAIQYTKRYSENAGKLYNCNIFLMISEKFIFGISLTNLCCWIHITIFNSDNRHVDHIEHWPDRRNDEHTPNKNVFPHRDDPERQHDECAHWRQIAGQRAGHNDSGRHSVHQRGQKLSMLRKERNIYSRYAIKPKHVANGQWIFRFWSYY